MQYHVIKKRLSSQVRAMLSNPTADWDCHPQASAYADLQMLFGKDANVLELKALHALVHHVYRHRTSYEIELEAGRDGAEQIEAHLEKIFEFENAPYDVDGIDQIAKRGTGGGSLSVGDLVFVDTPKPMIFMCASVGYVRLSEAFVRSFKELIGLILINERAINDRWAA